METAIAWLSFMASYWQWIIIGLIGTGVLAYFAFALRSPKMALAALGVMASAIAWQAIDSAGYKRKAAEDAAAQTDILKERIKTLEEITTNDKERSDADAATIKKLQDMVDSTPKNEAPAIDAETAGRIGDVK